MLAPKHHSTSYIAVPTGRAQRRIAKEVAVELARPDPLRFEEKAATQNVSARGIRVVTEHFWCPGDLLLLSSAETGLHARARVVYCQRLEEKAFAVGLELFVAVEDWTKPR